MPQTSKELEGDREEGRADIHSHVLRIPFRQGLRFPATTAFGSGKGVRRTCSRSDDANDRRRRGYGGGLETAEENPGFLVRKRSAKLRRVVKSVWRTARDGQPDKLSVSPPPRDVNDPSMFRVETERRVSDEWIFNRDGKRRSEIIKVEVIFEQRPYRETKLYNDFMIHAIYTSHVEIEYTSDPSCRIT